MNYAEATAYLLSFANFEQSGRFQERPDVDPVKALLRELEGDDRGDFNWWFVTTHVGGSKGKGSVGAMIESILCEAGHKTGFYSSPHLHDYTERIRTCRDPIAQERFARLVEQHVKPAVERVTPRLAGRSFVTFDLLTALGLLDFASSEVEFTVLEVGLGGRVDSTNVFDETDLVVLTPISLEHTAVLGDTIEAIAREKAGIIKPGANVVMAPQPHEDAARVFRKVSAATEPPTKGPAFVEVAKEYRWQRLSHDLRGQQVRIDTPRGAIEARIPLLGAHQVENAATAVAAVMTLDERIPSTIDRHNRQIADGLAKTQWPGRMEVVHEAPLVIVDGAHNRDSAKRFVEALREYFDTERAIFVIGASSDKDIDSFAEEIAPAAEHVIAARADHPRAMDPARIVVAFARAGVDAENVDSVPAALGRALAAAGTSRVICAVGSLFVAAEGRKYFGHTTV